MIYVVNKRTHRSTSQDFLIGRGTPLGNPWDWRGSKKALYVCKNREEAISNYKLWFDERILWKNEKVLAELRKIYKMAKVGDVYLVCYCQPLACHGEIIKEFIEEKLSC